ncbi:DEAD/DEAH box helicase [Candidatus Woesearchaeota archaeon]|jgi:helicase|nr:DEAD/DEAH box helicase [Candidatus Woesearchaeota archaeon]MBT6520050.1 DEAD/DEAH box helicase [Candidatus Woesearchaeota archaeon]MBT7368433.1 DEAD/DEAH box helicase [Candidatus Woesearchaeota archaeon]
MESETNPTTKSKIKPEHKPPNKSGNKPENKLENFKEKLSSKIYQLLVDQGIEELRPSQAKSINAGVLNGENVLVCTPTASGKTLVAEIASLNVVFEKKEKAIYIVPLKALASEKHKEFKKKYGEQMTVALSIGDLDASDKYLARYDMIICTAEKLDSLIRHHTPWIRDVGIVVIDEIHMLNDPRRGPTLEILITMLKQLIKDVQIIGLSATIGNEKELAEWLNAKLIHDTWRPVQLRKGTYYDGEIEFDK